MIKVHLEYDKSWRTMVKVERDMMKDVGLGVQDASEALAAEIRASWSLTSPSPVGSPPAVVTGNLDSAVMVDDRGRDEKGRFANAENTTVMFVRVDTSEGENPLGRGNYAPVLEGELERPFIEPAINTIAPLYGMIMSRRVKR